MSPKAVEIPYDMLVILLALFKGKVTKKTAVVKSSCFAP